MARIFVNGAGGGPHRHLALPDLAVLVRIVDLELIENHAVFRARETLRHLAVVGHIPALLRVNVLRFNHQRRAFVPPHAIAEPLLDRARIVLRVSLAGDDRNDARIVNHLDEDHRMTRRLHDLVRVVVQHVVHHRPARIAEADNAALAHAARFRTFIGARCGACTRGSCSFRISLRRGGRRERSFLVTPCAASGLVGNPSVRRHGDPRRTRLAIHHRDMRAGIHPHRVVIADRRQGLALLRRAFLLVSRLQLLARADIVVVAVLKFLRLFRRENQRIDTGRSRHSCDRGVGPVALKIRHAPAGLRRRVPGLRQRRRRDRQPKRQQPRSNQHGPAH